MSESPRWFLPFFRWSLSQVAAALPDLSAAVPGTRCTLSEPDEDGAIDLFVKWKRQGGTLRLLPGDEDTLAQIDLDLEGLPEALAEILEAVGDALAGALGGHPADLPGAEALVEAALAARRPFVDRAALWEACRGRFEVLEEEAEELVLQVSWEGTDRVQRVSVRAFEVFFEEWVRFTSWIGPASRLSADEWRAQDHEESIASINAYDGEACWQLALPVAGLCPARLTNVVEHVAQLADDLEESLFGVDEN